MYDVIHVSQCTKVNIIVGIKCLLLMINDILLSVH